MSEHRVIRDEKGRLLPGVVLNPNGRPKAKISLTRAEITKILEEEDFNPIREFIRIARHPDASLYIQMEATERVASYIMPKVKQVQITNAEGDGDGQIRISWDVSPQGVENARKPEVDDPAALEFKREMTNASQKIMEGVVEAALSDDDEDEALVEHTLNSVLADR